MSVAHSLRTGPSALASPRARALEGDAIAVAAWAGLVAAGRLIGQAIEHRDYRAHIGAPPLVGTLSWHAGARIAPAVALGLLAVFWGPALASRLRFGALAATTGLAAATWAVALAAADGWHAVTAPLSSRYEYLHDVALVGSPARLLGHFSQRLALFATHVRGHPPGALLIAWGLDRAGLGGALPLAVLVIAGGALAAVAVLVAVRELGGEARARTVAPFLAFAPLALWVGTSVDGLFSGVSAIGIALFALASGNSGRRRDVLALAAGFTLGAALFLSYGIVPLGAIVLGLAILRRSPRALLFAAVGVLSVGLAFAAMGFIWWDGLAATHALYAAGVASRRPYLEFLLIDLAALAIALGPAVFAGLARLRERGLWVLCGGALVAVTAADLSGLSRGETERIWLPFAVWLLAACATFAARSAQRRWLAAQVTLALLLQSAVLSPW